MHLGTRRAKTRIVISIMILTVSVVGILDLTTQPQPNSTSLPRLAATSNHVQIWLNGDAVGDHPGWNDSSPGPTITVTSGVTITLMLNATDILTHNWFIDTQKNFTPDPNGVSSPDFSFSATRVFNFTFTPIIGANIPAPGNWTYRCKYHPFPYMFGTIRILQGHDFTISTSPPKISALTHTNATATITINPTPFFTGTIFLRAIGSDSLQTTINPTSINPGSETSTLTIRALSAGNYTATITATSGSLSHSLNITIQARDFTIRADHNITTVRAKTPTTTIITIEPINHFQGTVALAINSTLCKLSQDNITESGNATLSCTFATTGQFTVQILGTIRSISHTLTVVYHVTHPSHQKNHKHHDSKASLALSRS